MQGLKRLVYTTAQQDDTVIVMWGNPRPMDYGVDLKFITERPQSLSPEWWRSPYETLGVLIHLYMRICYLQDENMQILAHLKN